MIYRKMHGVGGTCWLMLICFLLLVGIGFVTEAGAATVKNLSTVQQDNILAIEFDLVGDGDEKSAEVDGEIWIAGKSYPFDKLTGLTGDLGKTVPVGAGRKKAIWDLRKDFPGGANGEVEVVAWSYHERNFTEPTTGMEFVLVPGGCFQMGDTFGDGVADEKPVHDVCVSDFYIGKYEVTQGQWQKVMGNNPSNFKGGWSSNRDRYPVEQVSWNDAQDFLQRLNAQTGKKYRLPTEAEWEYAARSGGKSEKWSGSNDGPGDVGWFDGNSGSSTHPVGQKKPNGFGIFDMTGNVWEWCNDWYGDGYYGTSPRDNPQGASSGSTRVLRGGSWDSNPWGARAASRAGSSPVGRLNSFGFRLVVSSSSHD